MLNQMNQQQIMQMLNGQQNQKQLPQQKQQNNQNNEMAEIQARVEKMLSGKDESEQEKIFRNTCATYGIDPDSYIAEFNNQQKQQRQQNQIPQTNYVSYGQNRR